MTVLCNTQDGHFDVNLKEVSSLKGQLDGTVKIDIFNKKIKPPRSGGPKPEPSKAGPVWKG